MRRLMFAGALVSIVMSALAGCSTIAGLFPDKQKQYRYSAEIPDLEVPPDLTSSTIEGARQASPLAGRFGDDREGGDGGRGTEAAPAASATREQPAQAAEPTVPATLAQGTDDVPLIEIEEPFAETWNDVSRALGRMEIEISDQNRSDGIFYVYYGGETKKYEDRGLLADLAGLFTGGRTEAREYRIKLEEKGGFTNIYVQDQAGKAVSEGPGFELLKLLNEKLQTLDKPEQAGSGK